MKIIHVLSAAVSSIVPVATMDLDVCPVSRGTMLKIMFVNLVDFLVLGALR